MIGLLFIDDISAAAIDLAEVLIKPTVPLRKLMMLDWVFTASSLADTSISLMFLGSSTGFLNKKFFLVLVFGS
ncbi:hypothetical protein AYI69_g11580 [Smittium culicis]|uniref:Uncharacterized protein n=1 Tax=Smittium culicis TaxID=133412 RepID=A0A1R1WXJ5_9FUNG|nr:hypothetical protein AYI69_g11580 [Smittium culicis]